MQFSEPSVCAPLHSIKRSYLVGFANRVFYRRKDSNQCVEMQVILTTCKLMLCLFCFYVFSFKYLDAAKVYTSHGKEHGLTWKKPQDRFLFSKRDAYGLQHQNFNTEFSLKLAAFNVRIFGARKMATTGVPAILVKVGIHMQSSH